MTTISITKAISLMPEELQKLSNAELAELHKLLKDSKQKKALKKADIVGGILSARIKEAKQEPKQEELVLVENSVKTPVKKPIVKKKETPIEDALKTPKVKTVTKHDIVKELKELAGENEAPDQSKEEPKQEEPKQEPSFIRPQEEQPDLTKLSQEQLLKYIATLEQKHEKFPQVVEATKTKYVRTEFPTVKDIQNELLKNPMNLYVFADERIDDRKTQFLVLFASPEVIVLLDRNREKNTTITIETKNVTATHLKFPKDKSTYEFAFYRREKK
jgi:hypothetical protein